MSLHIGVLAMILLLLVSSPVSAQSLEEQTRRPPGRDRLHDDSERMKGYAAPGTSTLHNDSMRLRGRTADEAGTNSLDNGSMDAGAAPESGADTDADSDTD